MSGLHSMPIARHAKRLLVALAAAFALACATPDARPHTSTSTPLAQNGRAPAALPGSALATALAMIGAPYRYGGSSPQGFDCSGLVVYSFAQAGHPGLPHSAHALERLATPVAIADLEPGDLLFFTLSGSKTSHVAIYAGDATFVHAPSAGKPVERVSFDHVFWGPRIQRAGRIPGGNAGP